MRLYARPSFRGGVADSTQADTDRGGNVLIHGGATRFENCIIEGGRAFRSGGGVYTDQASQAYFVRCRIVDNIVTGGCGNCGGGGLYAEFGSGPRLINCEFAGNRADASNGGGVFVFRCGPTFSNTLFWGSQAPLGAEIAIPFCPSHPIIQYCDIAGGIAGIHQGAPAPGGDCAPSVGPGVIDSDPLLAVDGNLLPGSPCIDAGANAAVPQIDPADLDGDGNFMEPTPIDFKNRNRIVNNTVDIGAHEVPDNSAPYGACCYQDGSCELTTQNGCTGQWMGAGVPCDPDPCNVPCCPGDVSGDGLVNNFDIDLFVDVLVNGGYSCEADLDCSGEVNNFDIDPFIDAIVSGECGYCP